MRNQTTFLIFMCALWSCFSHAQSYELQSPDKKLLVTVNASDNLQWQISHDGVSVIQPSILGLQGVDAQSQKKSVVFGEKPKVTHVGRKSVNSTFPTPFYKKSEVSDVYNELTLTCKGGYSVEFRAYNDGAAYRFISTIKQPFIIQNETATFNFDNDYPSFIPYVNDNRDAERYSYSFESYYDEVRLSEMYADSLAITPLLVNVGQGKKVVIMEAGLENYPGMFITSNAQNSHGLKGTFAPYPLEEKIGGHNRLNLIPTKRADYIAWVDAPRSFPWRVVLVTTQDTQLADNDMAQRLAPACRIKDTSWIKPGKVAWDWWNTCNLTGVDFKAGMNTPTYKFYIDFAANNQLEYIIIDDGWSGEESLLENLNPEIALDELIVYGKQKGVGIILWSSWRNIAKATDQIFDYYATKGIKGFKVDFFDRDDQPVIASVEQIANSAARHHLLLNLHGLKPYGIQRTYPNILNFEGVKGLENGKWEPIVNGAPLHDFPRYDVTAPYLRMLAGPMDYTPGAMINATRETFRSINDHPMSQGTRVHQMAMYTIFEAPLQMLADSPSKYIKEQECTNFIAQVPTIFDESVVLCGEIAEYIALARRQGDNWFVGAMTNWTPRNITINLSFLGEGSFEAEIFADGVNADKEATDYKKEVRLVTAADQLLVPMAPGGGWTAHIKRVEHPKQ